MGYIGIRKKTLPEVIKKYAFARWSAINEFSGDIEKDGIELYNEIEGWWSDCELFNKDDYPDLNFENLLPESLLETRNRYYDSL